MRYMKMTWLTNWIRKVITPKRIETVEANTPLDWAERQEWRNWGPPLDLVRGESYRQKNLQQFAGEPRANGYLIPVSVTLSREPSNKYDPNAIRVEVDGKHAGYIAKEFAATLAFFMDATKVQAFSVPGIIRGGSFKACSLGVHIWIDKLLSRSPMLHVSRKTVARHETPWPPHEGEGADLNSTLETYAKIHFPPRKTSERPGYHLGKHYTEYVNTVKELKSAGQYKKAERLLLNLVDAVEAESKVNNWQVAPWYYEQLAIIYRKQKDKSKEITVLERFANQQIDPAVIETHPLLIRLRKLRAKEGLS